MWGFKSVLTGAFFTVAGAGSLFADSPQYSFKDLGTFGGFFSTAVSINSSGVVAGYASNSQGFLSAFLYQNGVMTAVAPLGGETSIYNMDLNDNGLLVNGNDPAFRYENGVKSALGPFPAGVQALRVNNLGQMLVTSNDAKVSVYDGSVFNPIGSLGGTNSWGSDILDDGTIVGYSQTATNQTHAFIYKNGIFTDLGTKAGGNFSAAYSANASGTVVGEYSDADSISHAFSYSGGVMLDIQTMPADFSIAYAVNSYGVTVGAFGLGDKRGGFVYKDGIMTDLNGLVSLPSGYVIQDAIGINDAGQIIVMATSGFAPHAVLLTPIAVPEPGSLALAFVGLLAVGYSRARKARRV